jgi:hypothetical protein
MALYHYTTAAGLEGIIRTKSFWASDYRFLNDPREFRYGLDIFEQEMKSKAHCTRFSSDVIDLIERFVLSATQEKYFSVFIAASMAVGATQ